MERLRKKTPALSNYYIKQNFLLATRASPELTRCIYDCALNVLHRNIAITLHCKRKFSRHKTSL